MRSNSVIRITAYAAALVAVVFCLTATAASAADAQVKVYRGRVSVKAEDARFGDVMNQIARGAGFEVIISPDIAKKSLSTTFTDLDLERGIQRLMGLISHRNYFIYYGRDDNIKKVEVYGKQALPSSGKPAPPVKDADPRHRPKMIKPPVTDGPTVEPDALPDTGKSAPEKPIKEIKGVPYIPPASMPEYIPPHRGIKQNN